MIIIIKQSSNEEERLPKKFNPDRVLVSTVDEVSILLVSRRPQGLGHYDPLSSHEIDGVRKEKERLTAVTVFSSISWCVGDSCSIMRILFMYPVIQTRPTVVFYLSCPSQAWSIGPKGPWCPSSLPTLSFLFLISLQGSVSY